MIEGRDSMILVYILLGLLCLVAAGMVFAALLYVLGWLLGKLSGKKREQNRLDQDPDF